MTEDQRPPMPDAQESHRVQPAFLRDPDFLEWELERTRELLRDKQYAVLQRIEMVMERSAELERDHHLLRRELQQAGNAGSLATAASPMFGAGLAVLSCIISLITVLQLANPLISLGGASFIFAVGFRIAWGYWRDRNADERVRP